MSKPTTAVKERPIIFDAESVRAILDGRQTMTRRVVNPQPTEKHGVTWWMFSKYSGLGTYDGSVPEEFLTGKCPYGVPGDRIYVKERWRIVPGPYAPRVEYIDGESIGVGFDDFAALPKDHDDPKWRSPLFMPRVLSRLTLEVTGVRVEQLQSITEIDCFTEGRSLDQCMDPVSRPAARWFAGRWDDINGKRDGGAYVWDRNPWVWVVSFKVVEPEVV